ncbi:hypothetical protein CO057_01695 [Candidatus Uhrbacteria bacterium CG_4_9_14_0_2_um_filter_41_50]|uniref:Serine hydrolase family protein n=1 Tax=Candidatus Uhrbacteria bacterium CG_4_9_14_0_2_um_filter_41_50 TaxID=1975031 RepID=A0A2M8EPI9_9BACT|nr:MAG: hypothetical protein COZ45_00875 [Candidatus Uhrbacteria bacterium CG_4_10_14_3_um_filter_41_21]PIZ55411.1 MAG: hypothetical protein COY24_00380 [Candidatus Uhrbacteria bacterium CG_4_10_14_0_2_um_filter_41_21]PJB85081.1 MAG: hypothetical protein CO086_00195 [Candidatus Uhrbacteria bacterium CG_4_9_14_0_8_um_filter_41_16]PJC24642.1 MAG: hypothetical protein CO057_01695 [Candidatus Uhrbacteria bacterium CG_4_9_14_0_2_um_filter_41_50]PJE75184.1 MAG: hypothetical protein COV03_01435 [Candi
MKIILIHGFEASPESNFFPWLKDELRKKGHDVIVPALPNPAEPDAEEWTKFLVEEVGAIDDETIILGHSIGAAAALRFLEAAEAYSTPKACILVAPPWMIKSEQFRGFFLSELDFDVLMWKASKFVVVHSKDDDKIPADHAKKYADVLQATLVDRDGEGHYMGEKYPILLEIIQKLVDLEIVVDPGEGLPDEYQNIES